MTPKQAARIRDKIAKIKRALAADKKQWGGYYHDGQGLRYLPPELYIKLEDYKGAVRYFNWFNKNFPDDIGYPNLFFEWTFALYKTNKLQLAEKKALEAHFSNTYIFDKFFGQPIVPIDKFEYSNIDAASYTHYFTYSAEQAQFQDFAIWLKNLIKSEKFANASAQFIDIHKQLNIEEDENKRQELLKQSNLLLENY